jgi:hypothetical protein
MYDTRYVGYVYIFKKEKCPFLASYSIRILNTVKPGYKNIVGSKDCMLIERYSYEKGSREAKDSKLEFDSKTLKTVEFDQNVYRLPILA